jgi:hypothetical protein
LVPNDNEDYDDPWWTKNLEKDDTVNVVSQSRAPVAPPAAHVIAVPSLASPPAAPVSAPTTPAPPSPHVKEAADNEIEMGECLPEVTTPSSSEVRMVGMDIE